MSDKEEITADAMRKMCRSEFKLRIKRKLQPHDYMFLAAFLQERISRGDTSMRTITLKNSKIVEIVVSGEHFREREAVTFNEDEFIGICGWADQQNTFVIAQGFMSWVQFVEDL